MKKHLAIGILCFSLFCLSACHTLTSEIVQEVQEELVVSSTEEKKALLKPEDSKCLTTIYNFQQIVDLASSKQSIHLDAHFSGTVYLTASKEYIEKLTNEDITINKQPLKIIERDSEDDFNIRYKGKTYFTIQKISLNQIEQIDYTRTSSSPALLVFYSK